MVQCKGWEVSEDKLGRSQITQCLNSIESFRRGGLTADQYVLAHNKTGKNRSFCAKVEAALAGLVKSGLVKSAEMWSRQRIAQEAFTAVYNRYLTELPRFNLNRFDLFKQIEHSSLEPLECVPLTSRVIKVDQYKLVESGAPEAKTGDPSCELIDARESLAILPGPAGFGKSTTAFRLAQSGARQAIYVPAASITKSVQSTSDLLKQSVSL